MKKAKYYLNEAEWRLMVHSLNELRTKYIQAGKFTDVIDETILKIVTAPIKKVKVC